MRGTRREIVLAVQAHANAVLHATAAPRALVRGRLRDLLDLQQCRLVAQRIAPHAGKSAIDYEANAGDRKRRLGDVRRKHDASSTRGREYPLLLVDGKPRVERQDLDRACVGTARKRTPQ